MEIIPHKTPLWLKQFYPKRIWDYYETAKNQKLIYLSFDDGPIPKVTPWVLETLEKFDAEASFFCIGENLQKHSSIAKEVISKGHSLGNHTFHHVNGWKTSLKNYSEEVDKTQLILEDLGIETLFFRPPYGKISTNQADFVLQKNYKIIMWDVLSKDYKQSLDPKESLQKSIEATTNGSIIVFHDSEKAFKNLSYILPRYLQHFSDLGYRFKRL